MQFYLKREHLANSYFLNILARISKGLNPHVTAGVESLNTNIMKELNINYNDFIMMKKHSLDKHLIDVKSPDYAFLTGIENLVEDGIAFYFNKHGHIVDAPNSENALQIAVEALKDEFEGEGTGDTMEVSENGDTNSGVIQAILDDLKNRQADEVGRTVNLILKLNADKQKELLDEQQANSDEIDETINETGLDGKQDEELEDGANPLEDTSEDINDNTGETSFEDDPFADDADNNSKDTKNQKDSAPTLKDKQEDDKKSSNPFEGFESLALNGVSPLDTAGTEVEIKSGSLVVGVLDTIAHFLADTIFSTQLSGNIFIGLKDGIVGASKCLTEYIGKHYVTVGADVLTITGLHFLGKYISNYRFDKALNGMTTEKVAKSQGNNKDSIYMSSDQYKKAYKSFENDLHKILKEIPGLIKKDNFLFTLEKDVREKNSNYNMFKLENENAKEISHASVCGVFDLTPLKEIEKNSQFKQYVPQLKASYDAIAKEVYEKFEQLKERRKDFVPFINIMKDRKTYVIAFGFYSNVIVSEAFTESEFRDIAEGMAECLGEENPSLGFKMMNELSTEPGNEDEIKRIEINNQEGTESFLGISGLNLLIFTFRLALRKLKKYKLGENILRKTLNLPEDDYNKQLIEVERIAKANAKYLEGVLRSKSKFLTWCLDVGAIKVLQNPQFTDGLAMVVAIDTINPIEVVKETNSLKYKSQSIELSKVGVSKYKYMPYKNLGTILFKACEDVQKSINEILTQRLDSYSIYGGINPIESSNSDSGWVIVAHNNKKSSKAGTESQFNNLDTEYDEGTEGFFGDMGRKLFGSLRSKSKDKLVTSLSVEQYKKEVEKFFSEHKAILDRMLKPYAATLKKYQVETTAQKFSNYTDIEDDEYGALHISFLKSLNFADDNNDPDGEEVCRIIGIHPDGTDKFNEIIAPAFRNKFGFDMATDGDTDAIILSTPDLNTITFAADEGTESVISAFKNKWNSISILKPSIEMTPNEYQSLANDFKAYGKECLETLKVDIKNDPVIGLLGLPQYLKSNFEVRQDSKNRPMILIYKTERGLIPASHWKTYDQDVDIKTQNSKIDKLISVIKKSLEEYMSETKFKGMHIFPVIAKDLSQAYAVIANPVEIKAEAKTESMDLFTEFQPITAGFDQPIYGTESYQEMKENYKIYNNILKCLKIGDTLSKKLKEKADLDYVFGDRSYQACVESFIYDPNKLIDKLTCKSGYIHIPLFTLDPSKTSTLYKNEFLIETNDALKNIFNEIGIESALYHQIEMFNPNGVKPLICGYIELGCYDSACESLTSKELLSQLADNYLAKNYHDDIALEDYKNINGKYGIFGLESEMQVNLAENPFRVMALAYNHLTNNGMTKLKAEFYMNNLYQLQSAGVESIMDKLYIDTQDANAMLKRNKILTFDYLKAGTESALNKYSANSIYDTIKKYMQKSLDINGIDGIAYEPKYGILIGLESSNNIKLLAKHAINLQKENPLPEYMILNALSSKDGNTMNVINVPLSLGNESLRDIPQILRKMKEALKEKEFYNSLSDVSDISMKNIMGFVTKPLAGTGNQLQKHIQNMMLAARGETLKHAYTQYGVESYEFKNIQKEFEESTSNVFSAYLTSICLVSRLGMKIDLPALYQSMNN